MMSLQAAWRQPTMCTHESPAGRCWSRLTFHALLQVKSLAKTVADTQKIEQRLRDMYLLHQRIEEQNQQLRIIVALHNDVLESHDAR